MTTLTAALDQHLGTLRVHWRRHRAFPVIADIASLLGMSSTNGAFKTLNRLVDEGFLERVGTRYAPTTAFFALPLLGPARAGIPQDPDAGHAPETLSVEAYLVENPNKTAYCSIEGDSMRDAGLLDGDIAVVDQSVHAKDGDIVVAVVDGEITVKYLRSTGRTADISAVEAWVLAPANTAYEVIQPETSLQVLGVVTGSFRRFRR